MTRCVHPQRKNRTSGQNFFAGTDQDLYPTVSLRALTGEDWLGRARHRRPRIVRATWLPAPAGALSVPPCHADARRARARTGPPPARPTHASPRCRTEFRSRGGFRSHLVATVLQSRRRGVPLEASVTRPRREPPLAPRVPRQPPYDPPSAERASPAREVACRAPIDAALVVLEDELSRLPQGLRPGPAVLHARALRAHVNLSCPRTPAPTRRPSPQVQHDRGADVH